MNNQSFSKIWIIVIIFVLIIDGILAWRYRWMEKVSTMSPIVFLTPQPTPEEKFISEEEAINLIKKLPEVKEWLALFTGPGGTSPITGGKPVIQVDSKSAEEYTIHIYENLSDHIATFNWYDVNSKTGKIMPVF